MDSSKLTTTGDTVAYLKTLVADGCSGEVLFQSHGQNAKVYLHRGLIVWAFATGQEESFQSILIREKALSREDLLAGIKKARQDGKRSLDEILLALGISDIETRAGIIERHTRAALSVLRLWSDSVAQFNATDTAASDGVQGLELSKLLDENVPAPTRTKSAEPRRRASIPDSSADTNGAAARPRPTYKAELSAKPASDIPEVMERFRSEVPGFIAVVLIDGSSGMPIASVSDADGLEAEAIGAYYLDISGRASEAVKQLHGSGSEDCTLEELLITTNRDCAILQVLKGGAQLLYLLIDRSSNPGMARVVVRRYVEQIEALLP
ncbi:MAG: hypothetical protein KDD69_06180 [Bdellovibrionales bacterium]|nr:hypothetical protein [Bdellovibrionales bacterium]